MTQASLSARPPLRVEWYFDLLHTLVSKEFQVRYKNTFFGYAWSILHPLMFTMVYLFAFKVVLNIQIEHYALFLVCGVFPWTAFTNAISTSNSAFMSNTSLIKRVRFPRSFLVLAGVVNELLHFVLSIPVIVFLMLLYHTHPSLNWLWMLPFLLLTQLILTLGCSFVAATANLFFRDLDRLTNILLMLLFYVTPVVYSENSIPARFHWTMYANPMGTLIVSWRHLFLGQPVGLLFPLCSVAWAVGAYTLGYLLYRKLNWRFAELV